MPPRKKARREAATDRSGDRVVREETADSFFRKMAALGNKYKLAQSVCHFWFWRTTERCYRRRMMHLQQGRSLEARDALERERFSYIQMLPLYSAMSEGLDCYDFGATDVGAILACRRARKSAGRSTARLDIVDFNICLLFWRAELEEYGYNGLDAQGPRGNATLEEQRIRTDTNRRICQRAISRVFGELDWPLSYLFDAGAAAWADYPYAETCIQSVSRRAAIEPVLYAFGTSPEHEDLLDSRREVSRPPGRPVKLRYAILPPIKRPREQIVLGT